MRLLVCERWAAMARALPFVRLLIEANLEAATELSDFRRGRKRESPDDVLEQPNFANSVLDPARDLIGRLMVAVRIMPPAHEKRARAGVPDAIDNGANRALGLLAFVRHEAIGQSEEKHILRLQPELHARLFRFLFTQRH